MTALVTGMLFISAILQSPLPAQPPPDAMAHAQQVLAALVHSYPTLNHLFISGTGPSLPAEYDVPGHVAEDVIRDIATWILATRRPAL